MALDKLSETFPAVMGGCTVEYSEPIFNQGFAPGAWVPPEWELVPPDWNVAWLVSVEIRDDNEPVEFCEVPRRANFSERTGIDNPFWPPVGFKEWDLDLLGQYPTWNSLIALAVERAATLGTLDGSTEEENLPPDTEAASTCLGSDRESSGDSDQQERRSTIEEEIPLSPPAVGGHLGGGEAGGAGRPTGQCFTRVGNDSCGSGGVSARSWLRAHRVWGRKSLG